MGISNNASGLRPGVCTSTTRPTAPYTGQIIYETDTGYLRVWDGSAWDYLSQSQDGTTNIKASDIGAWTTFTPTFKFGSSAAATASTFGGYTIIGKTLILQAGFISSGSQSSGSLSFTLPSGIEIAEFTNYQRLGLIHFYDASPNTQYMASPYINVADGTSILSFSNNGTGTASSNTAPFTWANADECHLDLTARLV